MAAVNNGFNISFKRPDPDRNNASPGMTSVQRTEDRGRSDSGVADQIVDIVEDLVDDAVRKRTPSYVLCEVLEQTSDAHYNVYVVPDTTQVLSNIVNNTPYKLSRGDLVYICRMNQNLSTAYIASKVIPYSGKGFSTSVGEGAMVSGVGENYIYYRNGRWKISYSDSFLERLNELRENGCNKVQIGIARILDQKSSAGRCKWIDKKRMDRKPTRYTYSTPEYLGVHRTNEFGCKLYWASKERVKKKWDGKPANKQPYSTKDRYYLYPIVDEIRLYETVDITNIGEINKETDITDIVNIFLFKDDYNVRRSWRRGTRSVEWDIIQKHYDAYGYWYKMFGIYIRACNDTHDLVYITPRDSAYTVRVYSLEKEFNQGYVKYNEGNIKIYGGNIIALTGDSITPYSIPDGYYHRIDKHVPIIINGIKVSETSAKPEYFPHVLASFTDNGTHDVPGEYYCGELPIGLFDVEPPLDRNGRFGIQTYTFTLKGTGQSTTVTIKLNT